MRPELTEEQRKIIEEQKAQCPYCLIVAGKIPAKKVYEDGKILAVLDIRPAKKGHIVVFTKEHYQIMPLIPDSEFTHLFTKIKDLSKCMCDAMISPGSTYYIANGPVAGQMTRHFTVNLIPREYEKDLPNFDIPQKNIPQEEIDKYIPDLKNQVYYKMNHYLKHNHKDDLIISEKSEEIAKQPIDTNNSQQPQQAAGQPKQRYSKEVVIKTIENNPTFRELITKHPEQLYEIIKHDKTVEDFFADVNIDEIIAHFNPDYKKQNQTPKDKNKRDPENDKEEISTNEIDAVSNMFLGKK